PVHFIFHTALCRSTLLTRALNIEGVSIGLSEPGIVLSLLAAGDEGRDLIAPILALLARPASGGEAVFIKPSNHANRLVPALLGASPGSRVILMTSPLETFLASVASKGIDGRRWARGAFHDVRSYAGMNLALGEADMGALTDMEAAGLSWLLNQSFFAFLLKGQWAKRLRILDSEVFNAARAETLGAALDLAGVTLEAEALASAATSEVFSTHAKFGSAFTASSRATILTDNPAIAQEIEQVSRWIAGLAEQSFVPLPLVHDLFDPAPTA
ncbi:MAG: hypothetical protein HRT64_13985, partial [Erythrobacter sp.]|nr:hypothetical protein [Erythrobacter sp.]